MVDRQPIQAFRARGTIRRAAALAVGIIVALAAATALVQRAAFDRAIEAAESVERMQAIRLSVERLRRALREAQVAGAALALGADTDATSLMSDARALARLQLDDIGALTGSHAGQQQQQQLSELRDLVERRFAQHDAIAAAAARGDIDAARRGVAAMTAGADASAVVRLLQGLERIEQEQLAARRTGARRDRFRTEALLAGGSVIATAAMLALLGWGERTRARERLAESRRRYQDLFDLSPVPMLVFERGDLRLREVNAAAQRCYGWARDELLGMTLDRLLPPPELPALRALLASIDPDRPADSGRQERDMVHLARDGRRIDVRLRVGALSYERRPALLALVEDVTAQRAHERERLALQRQIDDLVEHMSEGFALLDGEWRYRYLNEKAAELLGRPKTVLVGRPIWELFPELDDTDFGRAMRRAAAERVASRCSSGSS